MSFLDSLVQRLGAWLLAPKLRYSRAGYQLRALFQPLHGEDVIDAAVMLLAVNGVRGDVVEFGVFQGRSLQHLWFSHRWFEHLIRDEVRPILRGADPEPLTRHFWGYDSFEGLPAHDEPVAGQPKWIAQGAFAAPLAFVERGLRKARIPESAVTLVPGWYEDSLAPGTDPHPARVALAHIDCDLYSSTAHCLEFLAPRLVDGAIVIFDDWWLHRGHPDQGEQRAFAEFRAVHPELSFTELARSTTVSFLVHRRDADGARDGA